jgi:hypothetical protein
VTAFASTDELASHLQQDLDLATATLALDLATGIVQGAIGATITQATITAVLHVTDPCNPWLRLPQAPATLVTAVTVGGAAVTDYIVTPAELWRAIGWATTQTYDGEPVPVTVAYTGGFAVIPADVKAATLFVAGQIYGNPELLQSVSIDDYSATRMSSSDSLLPQVLVEQLRARYGSGVHVTGSR